MGGGGGGGGGGGLRKKNIDIDFFKADLPFRNKAVILTFMHYETRTNPKGIKNIMTAL